LSEPANEIVERTGQRLVSFYDSKPIKSGDVSGVEQLSLARASKFDLRGPAVTRVVYVTHPSDEQRLVPFADYDEELARDRLNEALHVFTELGASRIVATSNRSDISRAHLQVGKGAVGVGFRGDRTSSWTVAFDHRGTGAAPRDPRPLRYPDEPGVEAACEGVLRLGGQRYKIEIQRSTQYGADGELGVRLKRAGFRLGVSGTRTQSNLFVIEAVFGPEAVTELDAVVEAASQDEPPKTRAARRLFGDRSEKLR
jgi:hypothetical protein